MIEPNTTPGPTFDFAAYETERRTIETSKMAPIAAERRNDDNWAIDRDDGSGDPDGTRQDKQCTAAERRLHSPLGPPRGGPFFHWR